LLRQARAAGVDARVRIRPAVAQRELPALYSAADVLLLTSVREGWPNVLLEAMACGTPVVAMNVGGVAEIVGGQAGRLVHERTAQALRDAIDDIMRAAPSAGAVRAHALEFSWRPIVSRYREVMREAASAAQRPGTTAAPAV
jgi:glycosyltransferase involved in cell wall biosynthesis